MVGIGIVGIGFMGMIHYLAAAKLTGGCVVTLCSRDPKKLASNWIGVRGNFGPEGSQMDLSEHARFEDIGDLLAEPRVELVDLCVPNDEHARLAIRALEAGKHVLVEKPIALTTRDVDAMAAARSNGKLLMVAHVLPFFPEFAFAAEAVRTGLYGALRAAHFKRVVSWPDWSTRIADADRSGGPALDLHIHDTHYIALLRGVPRAIQARGVVEAGAVVHLTTLYLYDDPNLTISAVSGTLSQAGRPLTHGFEIYLERAALALRVRQPRRPGVRGDSPIGDPARRDGQASPARLGRPDQRLRRGTGRHRCVGGRGGRSPGALGRAGPPGPDDLPCGDRECQDSSRSRDLSILLARRLPTTRTVEGALGGAELGTLFGAFGPNR